jgi:hypothetical protein
MNKAEFKRLLKKATGCTAQYNGWTCGTCFFSLSKELNNEDWQGLLLYRGDYEEKELDNIPRKRQESLNKISAICEASK